MPDMKPIPVAELTPIQDAIYAKIGAAISTDDSFDNPRMTLYDANDGTVIGRILNIEPTYGSNWRMTGLVVTIKDARRSRYRITVEPDDLPQAMVTPAILPALTATTDPPHTPTRAAWRTWLEVTMNTYERALWVYAGVGIVGGILGGAVFHVFQSMMGW